MRADELVFLGRVANQLGDGVVSLTKNVRMINPAHTIYAEVSRVGQDMKASNRRVLPFDSTPVALERGRVMMSDELIALKHLGRTEGVLSRPSVDSTYADFKTEDVSCRLILADSRYGSKMKLRVQKGAGTVSHMNGTDIKRAIQVLREYRRANDSIIMRVMDDGLHMAVPDCAEVRVRGESSPGKGSTGTIVSLDVIRPLAPLMGQGCDVEVSLSDEYPIAVMWTNDANDLKVKSFFAPRREYE